MISFNPLMNMDINKSFGNSLLLMEAPLLTIEPLSILIKKKEGKWFQTIRYAFAMEKERLHKTRIL